GSVAGGGRASGGSRTVVRRRRGVAADARFGEVRLCHSSCEAAEQSWATGCGGGGAKGRGQGKRGPAKHAPDPEPDTRDPGAEPRTASCGHMPGPISVSPSNTQGRSRMPEWGSSGSARGVSSNGHPYRDPPPTPADYQRRQEGGLCWHNPPSHRLHRVRLCVEDGPGTEYQAYNLHHHRL